MLSIGFVEFAACCDFQVKDLRDGRRISLQDHILGPIRTVAHIRSSDTELRLKNAHGWRGGFYVREIRHVVGKLREQFLARKPFAGWPRQRCPRESIRDDGVRAEIANAAKHVVVKPVNHRTDGYHRGDANNDSKNRERRAQ